MSALLHYKKAAVLLVAAFSITSLTACFSGSSTIEANERAIEAHLSFLADDLLEGRDTGSRGHQIASAYIATQFKSLGLEPAGTEGYYQDVAFRTARLVDNSAAFFVHDGSHTTSFTAGEDFVTRSSAHSESLNVTAPAVFVGYGLESDYFGIHDYQNIDVQGAIVVMLAGTPEHLPSEEAAHLNQQKQSVAIAHGAVGIVTLHTPKLEESRPFEMMRHYMKGPRMQWLNADGKPHADQAQIQGDAYLSHQSAESLFKKSAVDLNDVWEQIEQGTMPESAVLGVSITLAKKSSFESLNSPNVIAVLPGSDPKLKHEYVLYTAHSDHLGVSRDDDSVIYNGAMDNASGVAILIETARMFVDAAKQGKGPKRSIIFAAVTAEERGLLGADYFAHYPTVPLDKIVANVNLDMPVLLYNFADVVAFGAEHSTLGDVVKKAAGHYGIKSSPDPMREQAIFTRSDHYAFVKKGIPAVFLMTGFESKTKGEDGGEVWADFFEHHYHQPGDSIEVIEEKYGQVRYDAAAVFTNINYQIGQVIGSSKQVPQWREDSFFSQALPARGE